MGRWQAAPPLHEQPAIYVVGVGPGIAGSVQYVGRNVSWAGSLELAGCGCQVESCGSSQHSPLNHVFPSLSYVLDFWNYAFLSLA